MEIAAEPQSDQEAMIRAIDSEPGVAEVIAAMKAIQGYLPNPMLEPQPQTHFTLGTSS